VHWAERLIGSMPGGYVTDPKGKDKFRGLHVVKKNSGAFSATRNYWDL